MHEQSATLLFPPRNGNLRVSVCPGTNDPGPSLFSTRRGGANPQALGYLRLDRASKGWRLNGRLGRTPETTSSRAESGILGLSQKVQHQVPL